MKTFISLSFFVILPSLLFCGTTRFWINGGSGNFTDGTHWSYNSNGSQIGGTINWAIDDIAKFDAYSGSPTVIFTGSEQIGKLHISGSITVTFKPNTSASRTFGVNTIASDAMTIAAGATLIIKGTISSTDRNMYVELDGEVGLMASISGTVKVSDEGTGYGEFRKEGSDPTINFNSGSTYEHNSKESGSNIPVATWNAGSTCLITGITVSYPGNLDQSFGNLTWDCPNQTAVFNLPTIPSIQGNFTINSTGSGGIKLSDAADITLNVGGNYTQTGGNFYPANTSGNIIINIGGNFSFSGGILSCPGSGSCLFRFNTAGLHTYSKTGGTYSQKIHFEVVNGATLDMGESEIDNGSSGNFTLNSGGGLKTAHSQGIYTTSNTGCVRLTGTRSYNSSANYTFYRNGSQSTGTGLATSLGATLTIGSTANATILTLSNGSVAINGTLVLVSNATTNSSVSTGTVTYGGTGTLEYQGASAQTTANKEFPSTSGPFNLKINNVWGVTLHDNRSLNGTLSLSGGALSIGAHTLTLNGGITKTGGTLSGGTSSNIIFGGSGASTNLPEVILNDLILNRLNGIGLSGNVTVHGTFTITKGGLSLNGFVLAYGTSGTLKYNGSTVQTIFNAEFPVANGPYNLDISNPYTVYLNGSRTLEGNLMLNNGTFAIEANTMTLNGLIVPGPSGNISGGNLSNIIFGGTGNGTTLPAITLNDLTIQRSSGITMGGLVTIEGILHLNSGNFSISNNSLVMDGIFSMAGGALVGGMNSDLTFSGSGGNCYLPGITLLNLTINRPAVIEMEDDIGIYGNLFLDNGTLSIASTTLNMFGIIFPGGGSLNGGIYSSIYFGESPFSSFIPDITLYNLTIDRTAGVVMDGNVTIENELILVTGEFSIALNTLYINGEISYLGGTLGGGDFSNLVFGGSGSTGHLNTVMLNDLILNRASGLYLDDNIDVEGTFYMMNGPLMRQGFSMYGPNATLQYQGLVGQTTSDEEWPDTDGPRNVVIINPFGVNLHDSKTVEGNLNLLHGQFILGEDTLTINGNIVQMFGVLKGGINSSLYIGGFSGGTPIPPVDLRNLIIDRPAGAWLTGYTTIYRSLNLINGPLMVNSEILVLDGDPIAGNPNNLFTNSFSNLFFGGSSPGVFIPSSVINLKQLSVSNPEGVKLMSDLFIKNLASISGYLNCSNKKISGTGDFSLAPGARLSTGHPSGIAGCLVISGMIYLDSEADYEFNGETGQITNFLPTSDPGFIHNLIINTSNGATVTLSEDLTVNQEVEVSGGSAFVVPDGRILKVQGY